MISVVIPGYNAEKTIEACLNSFVEQTDKDFEVIFVDDGSTDKTLMLANEFVGKLNITVLTKENGGLCSAVSYGINFAKGDYLVSIDSDDTVEKDFIQKIKEESKGYDVLEYGFNIVNVKGKIGESSHPIKTCEGKEEMKRVLENLYFKNHSFTTFKDFTVHRWAMAIKTSIVKEFVNEYKEWNFGMYEDLTYVFLALSLANNAKIIPYKGVNYYQRKNTHSRTAFLQFDSLISLREKLRKFLNQFAKKNDLDPDIYSTMEFDVSKFYLSRVIKKFNYKQSKAFFKQLKKDKLYKEEIKLVNLKNESFPRRVYFFFLKHNMFLLIFWSFKFIQRKEI